MNIVVLDSETEIATRMTDEIQAVVTRKPEANLGVATGSSPLAVYRELGKRIQVGDLTLAKCQAFALDEYVGLPLGHPESYRQTLLREFVSRTDLNPDSLFTPNPHLEGKTLDEAAAAYDASIKAAGGVDYQILGIGSDGHIAFNEPGGTLDSRTHIGGLTEQTRRDNSRFFENNLDEVPTQCMTQGLGTIMEAAQIGLIAMGSGKAQAVKAMIEGPISPDCPASVLQNHPQVTVFLDRDAASLLG